MNNAAETKKPPQGFANESRNTGRSGKPAQKASFTASEPRPTGANGALPAPEHTVAHAKTIAKALFAIGAAALAVFLLRQRFFQP